MHDASFCGHLINYCCLNWYDSSLKGGRPINYETKHFTEIEQSPKQLNGLHVSSNSMNRIQFATGLVITSFDELRLPLRL